MEPDQTRQDRGRTEAYGLERELRGSHTQTGAVATSQPGSSRAALHWDSGPLETSPTTRMAANNEETGSVICCCCSIESEEGELLPWLKLCLSGDEGWYSSLCCLVLCILGVPVLLTLAVLILTATDCDIGTSRNAAGSLLIFITILEAAYVWAYFYEKLHAGTVLKVLNTLLEICVLPLLMMVTVNSLKWLPSLCNQHKGHSLEMAAAASFTAMLVVQFYLAVNCKNTSLWHKCSLFIRPREGDDQSCQPASPDVKDRRLLCLLCDVPEGGSVLGRQALVTMSLSWLQVLLSLLGWLLLLAGCLLLNSNFPSPRPLFVAAGALTVVTAVLSLVGGWTTFLGETFIFMKKSQLGRLRLDKMMLALSTALLLLGVPSFCLTATMAAVLPKGYNSTSFDTLSTSVEWPMGVNYAIPLAKITAYCILALLLLLLLLALRNNAFLCRCYNSRCVSVCSIVRADREDTESPASPSPRMSVIAAEQEAPPPHDMISPGFTTPRGMEYY